MFSILKKNSYHLLWLTLIGTSVFFLSTDFGRLIKITQNMEIFSEVYREVNEHYVDETDPNQLMRTALDSMLADMDPYTNFYSEAQRQQVWKNVKGGWDGIGVEVMKHQGKFIVKKVLEESPAQKVEIWVGDEILRIDGADLEGKKREEVEELLQGRAGTQVTVEWKRPLGKSRSIEFTREKVSRKNVPYYSMLDEKTAYVVLTTFTERAAGNIADAFKELQEEHNPEQIILDLRNNGGGLLIEAVSICNIFIPKGLEVVYTRNKIANWDRSFKTMNKPIDMDIPLIILMNGRSASASEIVAGAIQDFDRGLLVGRNSFGKGLVQNTRDVGYNSKIKLTTAKYYIPSGRCIQALDYKDGKPVQIPDSLRQSFTTKNGRAVKDGNGLAPDLKIEKEEKSTIAKQLLAKKVIFDFATNYRNQHDSIVGAKEFKLTEKDFEAFLTFVKKYDLETKSEQSLKKLEQTAEKEGTLDEMRATIDKIRQSLVETRQKQLTVRKDEVLGLLENEIIGRYYFEKGQIEARLSKDTDVESAIELFADEEQFSELLENK
ncbi:MAG: S41 family peptidase [Saprospiraceae bacterium]|nr:S41 family peptidase [Saprospiraceae bacterium]